MSIVERALQKAQAKAKSHRTAATPGEPAATPLPPAVPEGPPSSEVAEARQPSPGSQADSVGKASLNPAQRPLGEAEAADALSLTSRDLKQIVQLDTDRLRAEGRLASPDLSLQVEDEIRRIKWPLLKAIEGAEGVTPARNNVVLVTSALPGEGKTFTSLNLALSIVRDREMRVVLVDGDVARPGLTPALGLENKRGLNDALEDTSLDISAVTYQTDVEGLFFVPAGTWHPHAPEFFAGSRMPQLMEALSARVGRGVVIFDSPPLLATNEAQVATRFAGQVLIVVRAEETEQAAVLDAIALVDKDVPISAVLNSCKPSLMARYYGQYYYGKSYGYGQHYSRRPEGGGRETGKRGA
jgi:Mrp family chromosome partitioning ATPase